MKQPLKVKLICRPKRWRRSEEEEAPLRCRLKRSDGHEIARLWRP